MDLKYLEFLDKKPTIGWKQEDQKSTRSAETTYADKTLFLKRNAVNDDEFSNWFLKWIEMSKP